MRELTYYVATSLDGRIAAPDGDWSAFPAEGDHLEAIVREYADTLPSHVHEALGAHADTSRFDTVFMGWGTYTPAREAGIDSPYAHLRQVVASRQPRPVPGSIELTADPAGRIAELKQERGSGIWLAGGGTLAGALIDQIDRLVLKINPVVLGAGIPLFGGIPYLPTRFERIGWRPFESGVVFAEYARR
ncbi:dihydrofolate reductase family protein [Kineosporia sp. NBRC 101731]|uniref:dihydrofolate reductase family protein n=1 Tax=Kineosporia sp. NBRC 101731 TaxID=3032199 RepID=UPI0024A344C0|nr:dihydrofolate reductase family protein [Kineosporia sp. NBRC 101731]GLY31938.1 deaminase [Kineosporia sp. NBRC 101731]